MNTRRLRPAAGQPLSRRAAAIAVGGVLAFGAVLAGCSSSSPSAGTTTTTHGSTTTSSAARSTTTTTTSAATSTTTAGVTTCLASQLSVTPQQGSGAAGTIDQTVSLTNTSATTCTLQGYPGMQLLDSSGSTIPTNVVRGGLSGGAPAAAAGVPMLVTLAPRQAAAFALQYEDVPVGTETTCPMSTKAEITPPNDTTFAVVTLVIAPCGGGTVHVSPVFTTS